MSTNPQARLAQFAQLVRTGRVAHKNAKRSGLRLAVDLGTTNIVLAVVDGSNRPVAGGLRRANVVRDGVVVDWFGAVTNVREILEEIQPTLDHTFDEAAVTIPPGISEGTVKVFTNVLDACELTPAEVVDEPVAAARALGVTDGTIIDVGHGTTGVSRLRDGVVDFSIDEATGGHHMTLVLSGALGIEYDDAEAYKCNPVNVRTTFPIVRPTLEKMATIAAQALGGTDPGQVYLVGGSASLPDAPKVFEQVLGVEVHRPEEPLFPTPLGAAMRSVR
ncbi:MAG: ethanolamine utilization protein EutJ [Propionibacteriaceae bacterium]|nr:ethanolamine utilization protein EutJ [Propionibacteriaceae bacterium]